MTDRSNSQGAGSALNGGSDTRPGSPVPGVLKSQAVTDAKAVTATFWDLL